MSSILASWLAQANRRDLQDQINLDSLVNSEAFYFVAVALLWLLHAGFLAYEAGAARRKNVMTTAMKNVLTFAVVAPTFYYVGWYAYGCFQEGWPQDGHDSPTVGLNPLVGMCGRSAPWSAELGPNLSDHVSALAFLTFLLFAWTVGSIMSGALIERVRLSAYLILTALLASVVWVVGASWGWSSGGWLVTRFGFHDAMGSLVVHGVAGAFTLGVLLNLGPRIGKYTADGGTRTFRPHNPSLSLLGRMLIFVGFYGFYGAALVVQSTAFPGWVTIYNSPTTLGAVALVLTMGIAGGLTGGWFASRGDPLWTLSGGVAGVVAVSAGADVYHPSLAYVLAITGGLLAVWAGRFLERKLRVDDALGVVAVHGVCGFYGVLLVGVFAGGYPTGINQIESSFGGQLVGVLTLFPLAFLPGFVASWILAKLNLLRVPAEIELEGVDLAEFGQDAFPEYEPAPEALVEPDGTTVPAAPVLLEAYRQTNGRRRATATTGERS